MTRGIRICLISTLSLVGVAALAILGVVAVVRSAWFREKVRERIVEQSERATGGRVEIAAFDFDWRTLTAELDHLVIHGTEPAGQAPLLATDRVIVGLRIVSLLERNVELARVSAEHPRVHVIVQPDGSTNLPRPRVPATQSSAATILDLQIGRFDVSNGEFATEGATAQRGRRGAPLTTISWNATGSKLAAKIAWSAAGPKYDGQISVDPLHLATSRSAPFDLRVALEGSLMKDRIAVRHAALRTAESEIDLDSLTLENFNAPVIASDYTARVAAKEASRILRLNPALAGTVSANGRWRYRSLQDFEVAGQLKSAALDYGKVRAAAIDSAFRVAPNAADFTQTHVKWLGGNLDGAAHAGAGGAFTAAGRLDHFRVQDLAPLLLARQLPYDGLVSGTFAGQGRLFQPVVNAKVDIAPATAGLPARGKIDLTVDAPKDEVKFGPSWIELPHTRVDFSGEAGVRLAVAARSTDLNDVVPLFEGSAIPVTLQNGGVDFEGTVSGSLTNPSIAGRGSLQNAVVRGQKIDSAAGDFTLNRNSVTFTDASLTMNRLQARVAGSLGLANWLPHRQSPVNTNVRLVNASLPQLAALGGLPQIPFTGTLNTSAQITGTLGDPHATADFTLIRGEIYNEPYDSINGHAQYRAGVGETLTASVAAGAKRVNLTAQLTHPAAAAFPLRVTFDVSSNSFGLNQLEFAHSREPELNGNVQAKAQGTFELTRAATGRTGFALTSISANIDAQRLVYASHNLGEAHFTATTNNNVVTARLDSTLPGAALRGEGTVGLSGDYPVQGKITFSNASIGALENLLIQPGTGSSLSSLPFQGSASGEVSLTGSARSPDLINASLEIPTLQLRPNPDASAAAQKYELHNNGPVKLSLARSNVQIDAARFEGPGTDVTLGGSMPLSKKAQLNVNIRGTVNMNLAQTFTPSLSSAGEVAVNAQVRGTWLDPNVSGRAELTKGDFHYAGYSNGLSNANGVLIFNGARATIQNLTAESGGGKVEASGFAAVTGGRFAFRLDVKTSQVRLRYPEGVSSVSDSQLTIAGTSQRSDVSGDIVVRRVTINPKADAATILSVTTQPVQTIALGGGPLANMNLDVQLETAPDVVFETSVAQGIEAAANLRLRGTLTNPALLGRITVTQGEMTFFGNKYTLNQGTVSFFDPGRIDPVLNVDLETKARGVDVILNVTGPIDKLNVSYRSDPPLQFGDIVALLATGRTPNDPTLAIRDTGQQQSFQQLGASALLGQALANPVSGRLQRFFGVSRIKIDPQVIGVTGSPEARLTVEQQVTPDILFTYVSDVSNTSTQLIRVEWAFNRRWSAILTREENGYVAVDFAFKKHFK
jgi:translocation and assembly module TamB